MPKAVTGGVLRKKVFLKVSQIHMKIPVPESLFNKIAGLRDVTDSQFNPFLFLVSGKCDH